MRFLAFDRELSTSALVFSFGLPSAEARGLFALCFCLASSQASNAANPLPC